jgi:hypothetical protein
MNAEEKKAYRMSVDHVTDSHSMMIKVPHSGEQRVQGSTAECSQTIWPLADIERSWGRLDMKIL